MTETIGLRFHLLGLLRIERAGEVLHLPRRKVEALVAYLLLRPERHTRDQLATLFWGDVSDSQARHSLRTALATIRKELAPELVLADREIVQRNPAYPCWIDLHELLSVEPTLDTVDGDLLLARLGLWQGELLAGYYDDWILQEREHYQARLLGLLLRSTQALRTRSDYPRAIAIAQAILTHDPANEHAHQHLMFCYMAAGDRGAALHQYEVCVRALQDELDAPPTAETTELYRWIMQNREEDASPAAKITNLPIPATSFIGRTRHVTEVKRLLSPSAQRVRLLTLTGAGGSGKTRLAIQSATDLIDRFAQGVWWVDLGALSDEEQVAYAVAQTLGVGERAGEPILQRVVQDLGDKQLLLVIDNCEHLLEPVAQIAAELLHHCRNLQLFTTSREALNVTGETIWQVPTLDLPDPGPDESFDALLNYECIRLFVERAGAVQAGFHLTPENAQAVAEICRRLDGIPLAIELAAARVKLLSVETIAARLAGALGARFALLTQGSRTVLPRQQTLRAAIDWSYDLLKPPEQLLFCQLAVFRGGFTLDALEQIVGSGDSDLPPEYAQRPPPASNLIDRLAQLLDKSLVIVEPQGVQHRYRLLETLREYALEQFQTVEAWQQLQQRHAEYFLCLAEAAEPELVRAQQQLWLKRLEIEHPNLRAALDYLLAEADGDRALRLAAALHRFWDYRGHVHEGREWLRKALTKSNPGAATTRAKALGAGGWLAFRQGDFDQARQFYREGIALFAQEEDEIGMIDTWQTLSIIEMDQGDYPQAQQYLEQSLELARTLDYESGIARGLKFLGALAWDQDRFVDARKHYRESLRQYQHLGDQVSIANLLLNVGDTERMLDEPEAAQANYAECLQLARALEHKGLTGAVLKCLGMLAFKRQEYGAARRYGEDALAILRELGDKPHIGFTLSNLGDVAKAIGDNHQALSYFGQSLQIMHEIGYKWPTFYSLEDIARLLVEVGQHTEAAVRFLGAADALRQETGIALTPDQQVWHEDLVAGLRQRLPDGLFERLWHAGQTALLDLVVADATSITLT